MILMKKFSLDVFCEFGARVCWAQKKPVICSDTDLLNFERRRSVKMKKGWAKYPWLANAIPIIINIFFWKMTNVARRTEHKSEQQFNVVQTDLAETSLLYIL